MAKTIVWNKTASRTFNSTADYLIENISPGAGANFIQRVFDRLDILSKNPEMGRRSKKKKSVRSYHVDKHRRIYYRIHGKKLIVVSIFDTRQEPSKNRYD